MGEKKLCLKQSALTLMKVYGTLDLSKVEATQILNALNAGNNCQYIPETPHKPEYGWGLEAQGSSLLGCICGPTVSPLVHV